MTAATPGDERAFYRVRATRIRDKRIYAEPR